MNATRNPDALIDTAKRASRTRRIALWALSLSGYSIGCAVAMRCPATTVARGMLQALLYVAPPMCVQILCIADGIRRTGRLRAALFSAADLGDVRALPLLIEYYIDAIGDNASQARRRLIGLLTKLADDPTQSTQLRFRRPISSLLPFRPNALPIREETKELALAAIAALERTGDGQDLARLRQLAACDSNAQPVQLLRAAAEDAIAAIEERLAQEAAGATLLRPAEPGAEVLLRPAEDGEANLLRAAEDADRSG